MAKNNHSPSPAASDVVVIRNYPASLIHDHVSSDDGSVFRTLSFRFRNAWASLILPEGSVSQSVSRKGKSSKITMRVRRRKPTKSDDPHTQKE